MMKKFTLFIVALCATCILATADNLRNGYYVLGEDEIENGSNMPVAGYPFDLWYPYNCNLMTPNDQGIYELTVYGNVMKEARTYTYQILQKDDGDWSNNYGVTYHPNADTKCTLSIDKPGIYDITYTFDPQNDTIYADPVFRMEKADWYLTHTWGTGQDHDWEWKGMTRLMKSNGEPFEPECYYVVAPFGCSHGRANPGFNYWTEPGFNSSLNHDRSNTFFIDNQNHIEFEGENEGRTYEMDEPCLFLLFPHYYASENVNNEPKFVEGRLGVQPVGNRKIITAINDIAADMTNDYKAPSRTIKTIENGQLVIVRDGIRYDIMGRRL